MNNASYYGLRHKSASAWFGWLVILVALLPALADAAQSIRPNTYKVIVELQAAMNPEIDPKTSGESATAQPPEVDHQQVQTLLDRLNKSRLNDYEQALVHQFSANFALMKEDNEQAYYFYFKAWSLNALTPKEQLNLRKTLGQLALSNGQWQAGTEHLSAWMQDAATFNQTVKPPEQAINIRAQDHYMLAQGYAQQQMWPKTVSAIEKAIDLKTGEGNPFAPEDWYRLALSSYLQQEDTAAAIDVLKLLAEHFANMLYWEQLASLYQQEDKFQLALTSLHTAYIHGFVVKERHIVWLAQLLIHQENFHLAGDILTKALKDKQLPPTERNLKLQANAWLMARQYQAAKGTLNQLRTLTPDDQETRDRLAGVERVLAIKP
ncbi:hypothetical protein [Litoribacillus peritrichatus]|uniref:Tetratricopeptide repeat protein n=1 Tax=Litoribacillus peritrichatus TaxID=718191 RepID=A0ABP7MP76_9GAMM